MFSYSTGVTLLVLIAPALAALGPPPGAIGKIDFRYPDYIVHERPHCPYEGVFPHPRNCSWYYRCHDPYQIGFYHQFYFECEPGTVFSDALDQCIHPFNPRYPCQHAPVTTEVALPLDVPDCFDSMIRCKVYLCPNSNDVMLYIGRLCESAFHMCKNGTQVPYCSGGQYFDVLSRMCTQNPAEKNCVDEETFDSTARPSITTTTTTTPSTTVASLDDCYDSMVECRDYRCPDSVQTEYLCKKAFQTCQYNQVTFYCGAHNYFNYRTRQCVDLPSTRGCMEIVDGELSTTQAPTTALSIDPSLLTFTFTVTCSVENPRPREERLAQYYCTDYPACLRGKNKRMELCLKYLQCVRTDNEWKAIIMECPPGLFFSYENDICISKPDEDCEFDDDDKNLIN